MSDDRMKLDIGVEVTSTGTEKLDAVDRMALRIQQSFDRLMKTARQLESTLAGLGGARGDSAAVRSARQALDVDQDRMRVLKMRFAYEKTAQSEATRALREQQRQQESDFRDRLAWNTRIARQRAQAEAEAEREIQRGVRETGRLRERQARQAEAEARRAAQAQSRAVAGFGRGAGQVRSGAGRVAAVGGVGAAVLGYEARRAVDALTKSGMSIDDALSQASIHVYGTKGPAQAKASAEALRRKLMPVATAMGAKTSDMIGAYVEAVQAGVEEDVLDQTVLLAGKFSKMNKLDLGTTLEESGYAIQGLKTYGKLTPKVVSDYFNHMSYLVATTAANRTQMSSFGKRGLAAGASVGMSPDDALSFGAAATAAGAEGNQAARMLSSQGGRVAGWELHAQTLARKQHKSAEDRLFLQAPKLIGFQSYKELSASFKTNFFDTFARVQEGLKTIVDPLKRRELEKLMFGQEFGSFTDAMVMGSNLRDYRNKLKSPDADNFIDQNWSKFTDNLRFMIDQIVSVVNNLTDGLGLALKPLWQDLRDYALQAPKAFDGLTSAFRSGLDGMLYGLGGDGTLGGLLRHWLGDPGKFKVDARAVFDFAKGFGTGLRETARQIKSVLSAFTGSDISAETIGRLSARFLSLSAACLSLAPVLGALGGLTSIVIGLTGAVRAAATFLTGGAAGAAGGAGGGAVAGALASVARLLAGGFVVGLAGAIGNMRGEISTMILTAVKPLVTAIWEGLKRAFTWEGMKDNGKALLQELVPAPLQRWLEGDGASGSGKPSSGWQDPPMRKPVQKLQDAIDENTAAVRDGATIQRQSFEAENLRDLIHPASLGGTAGTIANAIRSTAGRAAGLSGVIGGGGGRSGGFDYSGPALAHSLPGHRIGGISGMRPGGIIGRSGGNSSSPAAEGASEPIAGTLNPRLAGSRKSLIDELDRDPGLRRDVFKTISMENRGSPAKMQAVLESMVNRAKMNGYGSLRQAIHSGFYGPVNRGGLSGALSDKDRRDGEAALAQVRAGSNAIGYRTDQGMLTDPGARRYMREPDHSGHKVIGGENYFFMGQKGREWARRQEALDAAGGTRVPAGAGITPPVAQAQAEVRRSQDVGGGITGSGWRKSAKNAFGGSTDIGLGGGDRQGTPGEFTPDKAGGGSVQPPRRPVGLGGSPDPRAGNIPLPPARPAGLGANVPLRAGAGGGGGGVTHQHTHQSAPTINVQGGGDPHQTARAVQRALADDMNRRVHDVSDYA